MKRSTVVLVAVAVAGVATVAFLARGRATPVANAARPNAPGPNGVPGFDASTVSDILKNTNNILGGLGFYPKQAQGSFDPKPATKPAKTNDTPVASRTFPGVWA